LSDPGVHILDPFTGTGTFIVRALQSGLISHHDLARKYAEELHANEILLLAYYIAAINIESTYHDLKASNTGGEIEYEPFSGIVLTDTFHLGEGGEGTGRLDVFPVNNERASRQQHLDIRVILGNPPYSVGQETEDADNRNLTYPRLDGSIESSYATRSTAKNKVQLYDSYVRAFRWATERIVASPHGGIVAYVTNGGYIDNRTFDGFRRTVAAEYHHIYCYNLRGNQRTSGEMSRREGGKVFGGGSRAPVAITLLVREPGPVPASGAVIHYRDVGDYRTREEKLAALELRADSSSSLALDAVEWDQVHPNEHGDWINQRSEHFDSLHPLTEQDQAGPIPIFGERSNGLKSNRDAWNYNSSRLKLASNTVRAVEFYNAQVDGFHAAHADLVGTVGERVPTVKEFIARDPTRFSWTRNDYSRVAQGEKYVADESTLRTATYRPFFRQHLDFNLRLNSMTYRLPRCFPRGSQDENIAICIPHPVTKSAFGALMVAEIPSQHLWPEGTLTLPRYVYNDTGPAKGATLFDAPPESRRENITDAVLADWREQVQQSLTKDDIFFYIYGVLHSPQYREVFDADLRRQVARIPRVEDSQAWLALSQAGRDLADLHLGYETVEPWPDLVISTPDSFRPAEADAYRVEKIRIGKDGGQPDPSVLIYNADIRIEGIPERAYEYQVGSKSAIDWAIDRYQVSRHKESGIVNDPNDWSDEHDDPAYIVSLLQKLVTVSMRTLDIIDDLPPLNL
jgi:predicted helicase